MSSSRADSLLFQPTRIGAVAVANRVVMAPLTRSRALAGDVPRPSAVEYYAQRASAGLIITEATQISDTAKGYAWTPGCYTDAQVAAWREVTDAVHAQGGAIFIQLWHVGRISHESLQPGNALPLAPSAIQAKGQAFTEQGFLPHPTPRALTLEEIAQVIEDFAYAARRAREAGFDGVEIHGAHGYLVDQFLRDGSNQRDDRYGGSIENRARFLFEVVEAVTAAIGADRTGLRLSPNSPVNDAHDSDPQSLFAHVIEQLNGYDLAYLHLVEGVTGGSREAEQAVDFEGLRKRYRGLYLANNSYDFALADQHLRSGEADLIAFGRPFISNPDLVRRLREELPLAALDPNTLYGGDEHGYTDYPAYAG